MPTITSHTLDGTDGTHAGGIGVRLIDRASGEVLLSTQTDDRGRLSCDISVDVDSIDCDLVFDTAAYWSALGFTGSNVIGEIVLRFTLDGPNAKAHMPIILSPHTYSTWKSD